MLPTVYYGMVGRVGTVNYYEGCMYCCTYQLDTVRPNQGETNDASLNMYPLTGTVFPSSSTLRVALLKY